MSKLLLRSFFPLFSTPPSIKQLVGSWAGRRRFNCQPLAPSFANEIVLLKTHGRMNAYKTDPVPTTSNNNKKKTYFPY